MDHADCGGPLAFPCIRGILEVPRLERGPLLGGHLELIAIDRTHVEIDPRDVTANAGRGLHPAGGAVDFDVARPVQPLLTLDLTERIVGPILRDLRDGGHDVVQVGLHHREHRVLAATALDATKARAVVAATGLGGPARTMGAERIGWHHAGPHDVMRE